MEKIFWSTQKRKISDLIPAEYNPRKLSEDQEKQLNKSLDRFSLDRFSLADPIIINTTNKIIGGHQRIKVLKKQGVEDVDVRVPNRELSECEEKELNLRLNKNQGEWDFDLLSDFDIDMLKDVGFEDLSFLENDLSSDEKDDVVPYVTEPVTRQGDIWILGRHRVMCGDSTMIDDVERLMDGCKVDLFLSDPPYNVDYSGKTKESLKIRNDKQSDDNFRLFLKDAFHSADIFMKGGAAFYIWHADTEGYNFRGACRDVGWIIRQCLIWNKNAMVMGRQDYHWKHEPCLYGWKEGDGHLWNADRKQTTVLNFDRPNRSEQHPTMKPVELMAYQIRNNTRFEDCVLDLFLGSGSTLIACEKTNRICYGMELDPKYVDVIIKRWEDYTGCKAERLDMVSEVQKDNKQMDGV